MTTSPPHAETHQPTPQVRLHLGDAIETLTTLPTQSVDLVVTSPPYWGLRDYRITGQYGQETTPDAYIATLARVFDQLARLLTPTGSVWLNLGDTFGGSWGNYIAPGSMFPTATTRAELKHGTTQPPQSAARRKDLQGVPWRTVFTLQSRGWWLLDAVVWHKPNARPESVRDRLSVRYESLFHLSRTPSPNMNGAGPDDDGVWSIPAARAKSVHAAPGALGVAQRCIARSCPPAGVVIDPFCGTGTTGLAALDARCHFIGIDLDPASIELTHHRLAHRQRHDVPAENGGANGWTAQRGHSLI